jgi:parallel beta-helix repeat protein
MIFVGIKGRLKSIFIIFSIILTNFVGILILDEVIDIESVTASTIIVDSRGFGNFTRIQAAVDAAKPGDTIRVWNGTYIESITINKSNIRLIGNSSNSCRIFFYYGGTHYVNDYASAINVTASGVTVTGFNISILGIYTYGIRLNSSSCYGSNITNNYISNTGNFCDNIFLYQTSNNRIQNNTIINSAWWAQGINIYNSSFNGFSNNKIITSGSYNYGISLNAFSERNDFVENHIYITGTSSYGIINSCSNNNFTGNYISTSSTQCHGIYLLGDSNNLTKNVIQTTQSDSYGIYIFLSDDNVLMQNRINTIYTYGYGIRLYRNIDSILINNTVNTSGIFSCGIYLQYSDNITISGNNITSFGDDGNGIYLSDSSKNRLNNNQIKTKGRDGNGIYLTGSSDNHLKNNTINTTGSRANGIYLYNTKTNSLTGNKINASHNGIQLSAVKWAKLSENRLSNCRIFLSGQIIDFWNTHQINTSNTVNSNPVYYFKNLSGKVIPVQMGEAIIVNCSNIQISNSNLCYGGIIMGFSKNSVIDNNTISDNGIFLVSSSNNDIIGNTINQSLINNAGIHLIDNSNENNVTNNEINVKVDNSNGINFYNSHNNKIIENIITTSGIEAHGINLDQAGHNQIRSNTITIMKTDSNGIKMGFSIGDNNNISNNNFTISGKNGYGILLGGTKNYFIINNNLTVSGQDATGIMLGGSKNQIVGNKILVDGSGGTGIEPRGRDGKLLNNSLVITGKNGTGIYIFACENYDFANNRIEAFGDGDIGIASNNSNNNFIVNCNLSMSGNDAHGFDLKGRGTKDPDCTLYNTTISTMLKGNSYDLFLTDKGKINAINCTFKTLQLTTDGGGFLRVQSYLDIQVYDTDSMTPIADADIEVWDLAPDKDYRIYGTAGYGGTDSCTDTYGRVENIIVTDRDYYYENTAVEHNTKINVKKTFDWNWEEEREDVNMSASHTEIFIVSENLTPDTPKYVTILRVPNTNTLNISWKPSLFAVKYSIFSNKTGQWDVVANISHPQTWCLDEFLPDHNWYFYKIQAFNEAGMNSSFSYVASYFLTDITPPAIPSGLTIEPVGNKDELNISWNLNQDDSKIYDIWWINPDMGSWEHLYNITHPNNFIIFSHIKLVNGTSYNFKIRSWDNAALASNFSKSQGIIHRDYQAPEAPTNLGLNIISKNTIELSWKASPDSDVKGYFVLINQSDTGSGGPYDALITVDTTNSLITCLSENMTYFFVVQAFDEANNTSPYSNEVWTTQIKDIEPPRVLDTYPSHNQTGVFIDTNVTIIFSIPMDISTISDFITITPFVIHDIIWSNNNTELTTKFAESLEYNTTYLITIRKGTSESGAILEDTPFILRFTTLEKIFGIQTITIIYPTPDEIFRPRDIINVSGTSSGFIIGTEVAVNFLNMDYFSIIGSNGGWSIQIILPEKEGIYDLRATAGNQNHIIKIIVKYDSEEENGKEDDLAVENKGLDVAIIFIIIIVLIIILIFLFLFRRQTILKGKSIEVIKPGKKKKEIAVIRKKKIIKFEDDEYLEDEE